MASHNDLGKRGEKLAQNYLIQKGLKIIETNWRFRKDEVDIIFQEGNELVFGEVKTRSTDFFGDPEEAVTEAKQERIIHVADEFVNQKEIDLPIRFDIISVIITNQSTEIKHIKDAFTPQF